MDPTPLRASQVEHVCVFREGAEVTRVVSLEAGDTRVRVRGLPVEIMAHALRVEVDAGSVRAFQLHLEEHAGDVAAFAEQAELDAANDRLAEIELALEDALAIQKRISALGVPERPALVPGQPPRPAPDQARFELFDLRAELHTSARKDIQSLERERAALTSRLQTLNAAKHARGTQPEALTQCLHVELEGARLMRIVYRVHAAKWAPTYRFFYERKAQRGTLVMRALVAQRTSEDWTSARISVSTALPAQWAELPELASLRVGRAQPPVKASGFRTLPVDTGALFADYDRGFSRDGNQPAEMEASAPRRLVKAAPPPPQGPPPPMSMPIGAAMPSPSMSMGMPSMKMSMPAASFGGGGPPAVASPSGMFVDDEMEESMASYDEGGPSEESVAPGARVGRPNLDFAELRLDAPGGARRGRLQPAHMLGEVSRAQERADEATQAAHEFLYRLAPPPGLAFPEQAYGFDFQYDATECADVPRDGTFHAIAVAEASASTSLVHVAVPREDANVYRTFTLTSPIDGAVLRGPVDIFFDGVLALTSTVQPTPAQGVLRIGAGIDEQVRVARNVRYAETTAGLMGGWTHLEHVIEIELRNNSAASISLEVRERVPVLTKNEKELEVRFGASSVGWSELGQAHEPEGAAVLDGGRKARVDLAPGAVETLRYDYMIRIATASELVGGNRRD